MRLILPQSLDVASAERLATQLEERPGVVLLQGEPGHFCTGMELEESGQAADGMAAFVRCLLALRLGPPAVAWVDGAARGGGLGLAAACDVVVAGPGASFSLPEALWGLIPGAIAPLLAERLSPQKLRRLALTAESLDAQQAQELGLVDLLAEKPAAAERQLRALQRVEAGAAQLLAVDDGLEGAIRRGAHQSLQRLELPEPRRRIAAWLDGEVPWQI